MTDNWGSRQWLDRDREKIPLAITDSEGMDLARCERWVMDVVKGKGEMEYGVVIAEHVWYQTTNS